MKYPITTTKAKNFANGILASVSLKPFFRVTPQQVDNEAGVPGDSAVGAGVVGAGATVKEGNQSNLRHVPENSVVVEIVVGAPIPSGQGGNEAVTPPEVQNTEAGNHNASVTTNNHSEATEPTSRQGASAVAESVAGQGDNEAVTLTSTTLSGQGDNEAGTPHTGADNQNTSVATNNGSEVQDAKTPSEQEDAEKSQVSSWWDYMSSLSPFSSCYANCAGSGEINLYTPTTDVQKPTSETIVREETSKAAQIN